MKRPLTIDLVPYYLENQNQAKWDRGEHHLIEDSLGKTV